MPDAIGSKRPRRRRMFAGVVIALIAAVIAILFARDEIADRLVDPAPTAPAATAPEAFTADEQAFYDFVVPRLARVSAEANELVHLANDRSRNLIELQARGARVESGGREIDDYLATHDTPPRFADAMGHYRAGIAALRAGMAEARSGFLNLDWDRVASAVDQFDGGATSLAHALEALQGAGGATPPAAATPATPLE